MDRLKERSDKVVAAVKTVHVRQQELALIPGSEEQDREIILVADDIRVIAIVAIDSFLASLGTTE